MVADEESCVETRVWHRGEIESRYTVVLEAEACQVAGNSILSSGNTGDCCCFCYFHLSLAVCNIV